MLNELIHSCRWFSTLISRPTTVGGVRLRDIWSRLSAPVELSTRYTTADVVLEIGSTSVTGV